MAAVLAITSSQGFGDVYFDDGGTHNINYQLNDAVWVDYQAPGMQTTVNLIAGGVILSPYTLVLCNDSRLNISGGSVNYELQACERSQITISGGSVEGDLYAYDHSQLTISGGTVHYLWGNGSGQIIISGGSIGNDTWISGEISITGGSVYGDLVVGCGSLTMSGGTVQGRLYTYNYSSQITMSGGWVGRLCADGGQITMSGGSAGSLSTEHGGRITMSGGSAYGLYAGSRGQITISGGTIGSALQLGQYVTLIICGSNFAVDGNPFGFGEITSILGGEYYNEPYRRLTGTLANGDILDNHFLIGNYASITLVPETALPIADAGEDQTVTDADDNGNEQVSLDGSGSSDSDGTIVSWVWIDNLGDMIPNGVMTTPTLSVGIHTITLIVTDNDGLTDSDTVTITVVPSIIQPVCIEYPAMDFNKDCKVDFQDFAIFCQSWLECNLDPPSACWE